MNEMRSTGAPRKRLRRVARRPTVRAAACLVFALSLCTVDPISPRADEMRPSRLRDAHDPRRPPIVFMPLCEVEPPRNVPAAEWKSPYCATWDDGCTECRRKTLREEPQCKPVDHYIGGGTCQPRGIVCAAPVKYPSYNELERVCATYGWTMLSRRGLEWAEATTFLTTFDYDRKLRRWQSDGLQMGVFGSQQASAARSRMEQIGRNPDTEFTLTVKDYIGTTLCLEPHKHLGEPIREKPDRSDLMKGDKR